MVFKIVLKTDPDETKDLIVCGLFASQNINIGIKFSTIFFLSNDITILKMHQFLLIFLKIISILFIIILIKNRNILNNTF